MEVQTYLSPNQPERPTVEDKTKDSLLQISQCQDAEMTIAVGLDSVAQDENGITLRTVKVIEPTDKVKKLVGDLGRVEG